MSRTNWADRLTPFTAGTALALLALALVVQPVMAQTSNRCGPCRSYYIGEAYAGHSPCGAAPPTTAPYNVRMQFDSCAQNWANGQCTTICGQRSNPVSNCETDACSYVTCPQYGGSTCTGTCTGSCDYYFNHCNELQIDPRPDSPLSVCHVYCGCGDP